MNTKTFHFGPQFLEYSNETALGFRLHRFQAMIRDILQRPEDCLFIDAPTASGKTFSFMLPTACSKLPLRRAKTLIISPTNLLIEQTYIDIKNSIKESPEIADINVTKINGKSLAGHTLFERASMIRNDFKINDIILANPDVVALFLTSFYDIRRDISSSKEFLRTRSTTDIFSELNVVIFDEYHVYSEEESGKIAALMYLSKLSGNVPKIIFTSATPQYKLRELLVNLGFTCLEYQEKPFSEEKPNFRKIRGDIELAVTDKPIIEDLDPNISEDQKFLYLFDHKIDAEISREKLIRMGLESRYIQDLSGFSNRATNKRLLSGQEKCILATNAAEQGLNLDVTDSHIEPGLYIENLTQRYGRIGRKGKPGRITVHLKTPQVERIPENIMDFSELLLALEDVFFKKDVFLSRIKRHFAAFLALCSLRDSRGIFSGQLKNSLQVIKDPSIIEIYGAIVSFDTTVKELSKSDEPDPEDIFDMNNWWNNFLLAIGFFRGQSTSVPVGLERDGEIMITTENIIWVKKWCTTELVGKGKESYYLIKSFKEFPSNVEIGYNLPADKLKVSERELLDRGKFKEIYLKKLSEFFETVFAGMDSIVREALGHLEKVTKIIYPEMLMPAEVELVSESQII
jgi:CRISPR-associated helicase Cas3